LIQGQVSKFDDLSANDNQVSTYFFGLHVVYGVCGNVKILKRRKLAASMKNVDIVKARNDSLANKSVPSAMKTVGYVGEFLYH